ncbi:MAG TPA: ATP-dependent DNA ligase, partial [Acidimicrobiales bacterium]
RNERPMTRYFPELEVAFRDELPERCVVDGEIVVPGPDGLDFWALQQRIHPARSRITMLAERTPAIFVAFDLLALDDESLLATPFEQRRTRLEAALAASGAGERVRLTPVTRDRDVAAVWFERFEGAGLDGLIAKRPDVAYQPNKRVMEKVKHVRTADCVVAGYRVHKQAADAVGSLLLGLWDDPEHSVLPDEWREWQDAAGRDPGKDDGPALVSVGVVGAFPMAVRRQLFEELQPLVVDIADHPWSWAEEILEDRGGGGRAQAGSRWNAGKDLSFVPLRPERVVEVRYDYMEGFRFRHTAQFVRWRPDRDPRSCGYDQLETPAPFDLAEVLAGRA